MMRVLILDPEVAVAEALAALFSAQPDVELAEPTSTVGGVRAALATDRYDVITCEPETAAFDGAEVIRQMRRDYPQVPVVVVSTGAGPERVAELLAAGALSWLPKSADVDHTVTVLRAAAHGEASVPGEMLADVVRCFTEGRVSDDETTDRLAGLTQRERDVLDAMVAGMSRREIAAHMYLSVNTVRTHVQHVLSKLHVHSALEAVAIALRANAGRSASQREGRVNRTIELPREASTYHAV
jgi:DNA-binding NarL/FixJ family response regulator